MWSHGSQGGTAYFHRQSIGECRQKLVADSNSTLYLMSTPEAAQLCNELRRLALRRQQLKEPRPHLEQELRRKAVQCMELHRTVQALEEKLERQTELAEERVEQILGSLRSAAQQMGLKDVA